MLVAVDHLRLDLLHHTGADLLCYFFSGLRFLISCDALQALDGAFELCIPLSRSVPGPVEALLHLAA